MSRVRVLQERAARAIPAAAQHQRNGDWLRHTDSPRTWWAGAALMHSDAPAQDLAARIGSAEAFYAAHRATPRFQVCQACPYGLDDALAQRGYRCSGDVSLQVAASSSVPCSQTLDVAFTERPEREWVDLLVAAQPGADAAAELRLLERVDLPSAYATAHVGGHPVAVGRAVSDGGWAGVFGMATLPDARRLGAGRAVLTALATWASSQACLHMYLQVTCDSPAAMALYRGAGFAQEATYHYRTAPVR